MRSFEIDTQAKQVAELKRREMEEKFIKLKLQRCEKGMPRNHKWEAHWREFIGKSVSAAVLQYLASTKRAQPKRSKHPTAPASTAPASQVAQSQNPVVGRSNSF
jgi:hypothetical protein